MPIVALNISPALVPSVETDVIIVPALHEYDLPIIRFINNDSQNSVQITIWNKPGAGAGVTADIESKLSIQPQSTYEHGPMVLAAGRRVSVMADTAGVISMRPHGWDIT